jgi:hypothetical protein
MLAHHGRDTLPRMMVEEQEAAFRQAHADQGYILWLLDEYQLAEE